VTFLKNEGRIVEGAISSLSSEDLSSASQILRVVLHASREGQQQSLCSFVEKHALVLRQHVSSEMNPLMLSGVVVRAFSRETRFIPAVYASLIEGRSTIEEIVNVKGLFAYVINSQKREVLCQHISNLWEITASILETSNCLLSQQGFRRGIVDFWRWNFISECPARSAQCNRKTATVFPRIFGPHSSRCGRSLPSLGTLL
jgi:hypothetical protein